MEMALLLSVVLLQIILLILIATGSRRSSRAEELADRLAEQIRQTESDTTERIEAALATGREEILSIASSLRNAMEEVAGAVEASGTGESREPSANGIGEELRPLFRETVESMDARLRELAALVQRGGVADVSEIVVRALEGKGFERVSVLDRPEHDGSRVRAVVEARRAGMTYKGHVVVVGGEIVERDLAPMHRIFP